MKWLSLLLKGDVCGFFYFFVCYSVRLHAVHVFNPASGLQASGMSNQHWIAYGKGVTFKNRFLCFNWIQFFFSASVSDWGDNTRSHINILGGVWGLELCIHWKSWQTICSGIRGIAVGEFREALLAPREPKTIFNWQYPCKGKWKNRREYQVMLDDVILFVLE